MAVRTATRRFVVHRVPLDTQTAFFRCSGNSPGDPDPSGKRVAAVRRALKAQTHIEAFFWECADPRHALFCVFALTPCCVPRSFASLFQKPRTPEQDAAFQRSLMVCAPLPGLAATRAPLFISTPFVLFVLS